MPEAQGWVGRGVRWWGSEWRGWKWSTGGARVGIPYQSHTHFVFSREERGGHILDTCWWVLNTSRRLVRTGYSCPVLHRHVSISCRSRVGSTQTGKTGSVRILSNVSCALTPTWSWNNVWRCMSPVCSHGTSRWRLKSLCLTTMTVPPTESLTPSPSETKHVVSRIPQPFQIHSTRFIKKVGFY